MRRAQVALEQMILTGIALLILAIMVVFTADRFETNTLALQRQAVEDTADALERLFTSMSTAEEGLHYAFPWQGSVYGIPLTLTFHPGGFIVNGSAYTTSRSILLLNATLRVDGNATLVFVREAGWISVHLT